MMDMPERVGKQKHHYIVEIGGELADDISLLCNCDFPSRSWRLSGYKPKQVLSYILLQHDCSPAMDMAWDNYQIGRDIRIIDCEDVDAAASLPRELWGMPEGVVEKAHISTIGEGADAIKVYKITDRVGRKRFRGQLVLDF